MIRRGVHNFCVAWKWQLNAIRPTNHYPSVLTLHRATPSFLNKLPSQTGGRRITGLEMSRRLRLRLRSSEPKANVSPCSPPPL